MLCLGSPRALHARAKRGSEVNWRADFRGTFATQTVTNHDHNPNRNQPRKAATQPLLPKRTRREGNRESEAGVLVAALNSDRNRFRIRQPCLDTHGMHTWNPQRSASGCVLATDAQLHSLLTPPIIRTK